MISFLRPVMNSRPAASSRPRSPVWSQPSCNALGRRVRAVEVLAHHDRPADQNLAVALAGRLIVNPRTAFRLSDPDLDAGKRLADRVVEAIARPHDRRAARSFREAVGVEDGEAEAVEVARRSRDRISTLR